MYKEFISEIVINNYRNYLYKKLNFTDDFNVIVGNNGVGKTNILEALSLFSDGKGLSNSDLDELINISYKNNINNNNAFTLFIKFENYIYDNILLICKKEENNYKKVFTIDNKIVKKNSVLNNILKINFLTPQMDTFFIDSSSIRRKFLDKTASLLYVNHYENVKKYEFFVKERMKILLSENIDSNWLNIVEKKIVELGVSIANIRNEVVDTLNNIFVNYELSFPIGNISIDGEIENLLKINKAIDVEKLYLQKLQNNRQNDIKSKKTNFGIHKSDLITIHKEKNMLAKLCSTGEQKLLLISLIIVRCIFSKNINNGIVILLLDEVCSHFDDNTKLLLFNELKKLDIQIFITGINKADFEILNGNLMELSNICNN